MKYIDRIIKILPLFYISYYILMLLKNKNHCEHLLELIIFFGICLFIVFGKNIIYPDKLKNLLSRPTKDNTICDSVPEKYKKDGTIGGFISGHVFTTTFFFTILCF